VTTDAERAAPSSAISPTYSPGPWKSMTTSLPAALLANTLTLPDTDDEERIALVALVDEHHVLRELAHDPRMPQSRAGCPPQAVRGGRPGR
jgi:hypothetical protein